MKKLLLLFIPLICYSQVTFKKSEYNQIWYDASKEHSSTLAGFDTSSVKISKTSSGKFQIIVFGATGDTTLQIDSTGTTHWFGTHKKRLTIRPHLDPFSKLFGPTEVSRGCNVGYSMPIWSSPSNADEQLGFRTRIPQRWDGVTDPQFGMCVSLADNEDVGDKFKFQIEWQTTNKGTLIADTTSKCYSAQTVLSGRNGKYSIYFIFFNLDAQDAANPIVSNRMLQGRVRRVASDSPQISDEIIVWDWICAWTVDKIYADWSLESNDE